MSTRRLSLVAAVCMLSVGLAATSAGAATADPRWSYAPPGVGQADDGVSGPDGTLYVAGSHGPGSARAGFLTSAVGADGRLLWSAAVPSTPGSEDGAEAVAIDPARGRVYVTGRLTLSGDGPVGDQVALTIAYDMATGAELWRAQVNGAATSSPALDPDAGVDLVVDPGNGQVVVVGAVQGAGNGSADFLVVAYAPTGGELWSRRTGGANGTSDLYRSVALDTAGNVYALGVSATSTVRTGVLDSFTRQGQRRWSEPVPQPLGVANTDVGEVLVDPVRGQVYTPLTQAPDYSSDGNTEMRAWTLAGAAVWAQSRPNNTFPVQAALGLDGSVLFTTTYYPPGREQAIRLTALSSSGDELWAVSLRDADEGQLPFDVAVAPEDGTVYVNARGSDQRIYGLSAVQPGRLVFYREIRRTQRVRPEWTGLALSAAPAQLYLFGSYEAPAGDRFSAVALAR